jgi:MFS transporter, DHA1 family, inner membrane transport protein
MTSWFRAIRGFNRNAYLLFLTGGVLGFTYWGITYLLTSIFVSRLGYGTTVVGNLNALFYILHMVASIPAGALGMRLGSRRAMMLGGFLGIAGWAVGPAAVFLLPLQLRMGALIASRVISAVGGALFIVNANPALMGAVAPPDRTYAFAFNGSVVSLMQFLGSVCGGFLPGLFSRVTGTSLASAVPYGLALWAAVVVLAPAMVSLSLFRDTLAEPSPSTGRTAAGAPLLAIAAIAGIRFLRECGYGGVLNFFTIYLDAELRMPTSWIGVLVSVSAIASIVITPLMPMAARRWGTGRTSLAGLLAMGVSVLVIPLVMHWLPAAVGWAGMTAANSINEAAMQVYILEIVAPQWRALMSGAANMATTLGLALSASGGGYLIGAIGYPALFAIAASLLLAATAAFAAHLAVRARHARLDAEPLA